MATGIDQTLNTPTVLLAGASSQIGVFAIPRLLDLGFDIIAVSRSGRPPGWPDIERVEWLDEGSAIRAAAGCRYLLSAGPMDLAYRLLRALGQLQDTVIFSSTSVVTKQNSPDSHEHAQARQMSELESKLHTTAGEKHFRLVIFRPTLVYGCGLDANISRLADWIRRFGFMPVNGNAAGLRQPVHADDLAEISIRAMLSEGHLPEVLTVAGGETLNYAEMVSRIFTALNKPARLVRLPQWLFVALVGVTNVIKPGGGINSEMVRRQVIDLVFDDQPARELLNYKPRPFVLREADFSMPDFGNQTQ